MYNPKLPITNENMPDELRRGLEQARNGEFAEPPDLEAGDNLVKLIEDTEKLM